MTPGNFHHKWPFVMEVPRGHSRPHAHAARVPNTTPARVLASNQHQGDESTKSCTPSTRTGGAAPSATYARLCLSRAASRRPGGGLVPGLALAPAPHVARGGLLVLVHGLCAEGALEVGEGLHELALGSLAPSVAPEDALDRLRQPIDLGLDAGQVDLVVRGHGHGRILLSLLLSVLLHKAVEDLDPDLLRRLLLALPLLEPQLGLGKARLEA
eukprot:357423-Alexandrium_andersonii.AAC.1